MKNRAKELRKLWMEEYVTFENLIRKIAREKIDLYKTRNKSLNKLIEDLSLINKENDLKLPIDKMKVHHKIRNWLVHQASNSKCPNKYLEKMKNIKELNNILKKI